MTSVRPENLHNWARNLIHRPKLTNNDASGIRIVDLTENTVFFARFGLKMWVQALLDLEISTKQSVRHNSFLILLISKSLGHAAAGRRPASRRRAGQRHPPYYISRPENLMHAHGRDPQRAVTWNLTVTHNGL